MRRLELSQESFAKFAYWTNSENNASGGTIVFASGDALWGPVWSNDTITHRHRRRDVPRRRRHGGADHQQRVGRHVREGLPGQAEADQTAVAVDAVESLSGLATVSGFNFTAPTTRQRITVRTRIEFVAADLNGDGDSTGTNEGFFRVYTANAGNYDWLRADWPGSRSTSLTGDELRRLARRSGGKSKFFPAAIHPADLVRDLLALRRGIAAALTDAYAANASRRRRSTTIMSTCGRALLSRRRSASRGRGAHVGALSDRERPPEGRRRHHVHADRSLRRLDRCTATRPNHGHRGGKRPQRTRSTCSRSTAASTPIPRA